MQIKHRFALNWLIHSLTPLYLYTRFPKKKQRVIHRSLNSRFRSAQKSLSVFWIRCFGDQATISTALPTAGNAQRIWPNIWLLLLYRYYLVMVNVARSVTLARDPTHTGKYIRVNARTRYCWRHSVTVGHYYRRIYTLLVDIPCSA